MVGNGPSKTWLLGNSLVTITTSGTGGGSYGVCPKCKVLQRSLQPNPDVLLASNESFLPTFRRLSLSSEGDQETTPPLCSCWCRGWSEIKVRRPTGNVAWLMRVQNKLDILATAQPSTEAEYDWSLMGVNTMTLSKETAEEGEEQDDVSWDVVNLNTEEKETIAQSHDLQSTSTSLELSRNQSHHQTLLNNQSEDQTLKPSSDQSHDQSSDQSHEQSIDLSHDQSLNQSDQSINLNDQSVDLSFEEHDQSVKSPEQSFLLQEEKNGYPKRIMAIKQAASSRQPSSYSWSEGREIEIQKQEEAEPKARYNSTRSYSFSSASIELLPPLFSYDEGNPMSRSPSLVRDDGILSDPEQVQCRPLLLTCMCVMCNPLLI